MLEADELVDVSLQEIITKKLKEKEVFDRRKELEYERYLRFKEENNGSN